MRILVISDIHANLTAFEAVLAEARNEWDQVWCLGDVVGYGPDPNECVELLRTMPHLSLAGNHDWAALQRLDIRTFNPDARQAVEWTRDTLTPDNSAYLEALPVTFVIEDYTLAHASPREPIWEYILDTFVASLNFSHFETPYCLVGHTHQPVIYELLNAQGDTTLRLPEYDRMMQLNGHRQIINPGSVGQPRDKNPDAAYAILDFETHRFEHRRVAYNISEVQKRMKRAGMSERLINRLEHGW